MLTFVKMLYSVATFKWTGMGNCYSKCIIYYFLWPYFMENKKIMEKFRSIVSQKFHENQKNGAGEALKRFYKFRFSLSFACCHKVIFCELLSCWLHMIAQLRAHQRNLLPRQQLMHIHKLKYYVCVESVA